MSKVIHCCLVVLIFVFSTQTSLAQTGVPLSVTVNPDYALVAIDPGLPLLVKGIGTIVNRSGDKKRFGGRENSVLLWR